MRATSKETSKITFSSETQRVHAALKEMVLQGSCAVITVHLAGPSSLGQPQDSVRLGSVEALEMALMSLCQQNYIAEISFITKQGNGAIASMGWKAGHTMYHWEMRISERKPCS